MNKIKVYSPSTVANLSCGFDVLGLCLNTPYDEIEVIKNPDRKITLDILESQYDNIPKNVDENTGGVPAKLILNDLGLDFGFDIKIKKGIPLCGGLGSSAATSVGVVFAINQILDQQLTRKEMLQYAIEGEKVSVSTPHADNVAPCLFGGLTLIRNTKSLDVVNIPISEFSIVLIHPHIKINTEDARKMLPEKINLNSAIEQWGNLGALVFGFSSDNHQLIKRSMNDIIIEPLRSSLIPGFDTIKDNALKLGALGCGISGSGPTIFALCDSSEIASHIGSTSKDHYKSLGLDCDIFISEVNHKGPVVV